ncbi:hypothetical protein BS50DRAFT_599956 [Corynespora cassiicola Philippines]|uniref:Polyprenal reductase n=1 Tax=Corynespora cassiicola Philippines TaxID=1448308 RepID=A0A2T2NR94_CORCC|nr:hypothetical protein BS50DRAFT_599956 [Corynespora cassiicola Philippines]
MASAADRLAPPAVLLRAFYVAASILILVIRAVPALNTRFLAYGSRAASPASPAASQHRSHHDRRRREPRQSPLDQLLDYAASFQVPHNFFTHFYELSVACSAFWGWRLRLWNAHSPLQLVWLLMLLQGARRFLESHTYTSTSKSNMWFGHWLLGLVFYLTVNVAVWVEGVGNVDSKKGQGQAHGSHPFWKTVLLVPAILTSHALQHTYHAYLYRLRTEHSGYQLPSHPLFPNLVCPHYTCEVAIYALLSLLAAPEGAHINWTMASATLFVAVNLGVTAAGTKQWYMDKFGPDKVSNRRRMIPWVW